MPRKRNRRTKRRFAPRRNPQHQIFPVYYDIKAGQSAVSTVKTLSETFDRSRAFRIASFTYSFCSTGGPCFVQFRAYGPVSSADNIWSSRSFLIAPGVTKNGRYTIPVTSNGWYPAQTAEAVYLFQVYNLCGDKVQREYRLFGQIEFNIQVRPYEPTETCPNFATVLENPYRSSMVLSPRDTEEGNIAMELGFERVEASGSQRIRPNGRASMTQRFGSLAHSNDNPE